MGSKCRCWGNKTLPCHSERSEESLLLEQGPYGLGRQKESMKDETRNLISKGDKDLGTAGFALNSVDGPLPVTTGLHCQKATENYIKAYLHENGVSFSKHNNLHGLFEACVSFDDSFESLGTEINQLEGYSIASRYPQAKDSLEYRKDAIATAKRVKEFVLDKLA
jgi:HEPN domain-containing protein